MARPSTHARARPAKTLRAYDGPAPSKPSARRPAKTIRAAVIESPCDPLAPPPPHPVPPAPNPSRKFVPVAWDATRDVPAGAPPAPPPPREPTLGEQYRAMSRSPAPWIEINAAKSAALTAQLGKAFGKENVACQPDPFRTMQARALAMLGC